MQYLTEILRRDHALLRPKDETNVFQNTTICFELLKHGKTKKAEGKNSKKTNEIEEKHDHVIRQRFQMEKNLCWVHKPKQKHTGDTRFQTASFQLS